MVTVPQDNLFAMRKDGLTLCKLEDEVLVYDAAKSRASCLNGFAAAVLELCDGQRSVPEILRDLPFDEADEGAVRLALADLQKAQLLQDGFLVDAGGPGRMNRRDLLRRVGVGSAVAVPVISGIAFPAAAATCASFGGGGTGAPCIGQADCAANYNCEGVGRKTCQPIPGKGCT